MLGRSNFLTAISSMSVVRTDKTEDSRATVFYTNTSTHIHPSLSFSLSDSLCRSHCELMATSIGCVRDETDIQWQNNNVSRSYWYLAHCIVPSSVFCSWHAGHVSGAFQDLAPQLNSWDFWKCLHTGPSHRILMNADSLHDYKFKVFKL